MSEGCPPDFMVRLGWAESGGAPDGSWEVSALGGVGYGEWKIFYVGVIEKGIAQKFRTRRWALHAFAMRRATAVRNRPDKARRRLFRLAHLLHHVGGSYSFSAGCNFENGLVTR